MLSFHDEVLANEINSGIDCIARQVDWWNALMAFRLLKCLRGSIFHPQWLSDRFHFHSQEILAELRDSRILDVGSGHASYVSLIHPSNHYIDLDYPATNEKYLLRPQIYGDARSLPVGGGKVDTVFLFEVLEHVHETESVLDEIARVLAPGGRLFLSVPFIYPIHDAPNDFKRFTRFGLSESLKRSGFDVKKMVAHGNTLVAALQMFNMGLLELCRDIYLRNRILGLVCAAFVYPITLVVNLLAWPLLYIPLGKAGCLGYFFEARKSVDERL